MEDDLRDEEICDVIGNYDERIRYLQEEISSSYVLLANLKNGSEKETLFEAISMPGENRQRRWELTGVYTDYEQIIRDEDDRIRGYIRCLTEKKDRINRIMDEYHRLPIKDQVFMKKIVCEEKPAVVRYMEIGEEMELTKRTILRRRRDILERIKRNFGGTK